MTTHQVTETAPPADTLLPVGRLAFTAARADLLRELEFSIPAVERKGASIPILSHVLVESDTAAALRIVATNLDVTIESSAPALITAGGAIVVSAKKLREVLRSLAEGEVRFEQEPNGWVRVSAGATSFKLHAMEREHFPARPVMPASAHRLPGSSLGAIVRATAFAVPVEESRFSVPGALLELAGDEARAVSTDGHRLALAETLGYGAAREGVEPVTAIIPRRAYQQLDTLAGDPEDEVEIAIDDNHVFFRSGARTIASRKPTAQFPAYQMAFPVDNDKLAGVDSRALADALRRMLVMTDGRSRCVKLRLATGAITVSAESSECGEAVDTVEARYEGPGLEIGFNAEYLLEAVSAARSDGIRISLKTERTQALLEPEEPSEVALRFVCMPMRLA